MNKIPDEQMAEIAQSVKEAVERIMDEPMAVVVVVVPMNRTPSRLQTISNVADDSLHRILRKSLESTQKDSATIAHLEDRRH